MNLRKILKSILGSPLHAHSQSGSATLIGVILALGAASAWVSLEQGETVNDLKLKQREKLVGYAKARNESLIMASQKLLAMTGTGSAAVPALYPSPYFMANPSAPSTTFKTYKNPDGTLWQLKAGTQLIFDAPSAFPDGANFKDFFSDKDEAAPPSTNIKTYLNFDSLAVDPTQAEYITHAFVTAETHIPIEGSSKSLVVETKSRVALPPPPKPQIRITVNCGNGQTHEVDSETAGNTVLVDCTFVDPTGEENLSFEFAARGVIYRAGLDTGGGMKYSTKKGMKLAIHEEFESFLTQSSKLKEIIAIPSTTTVDLATAVTTMDIEKMKFDTTCETPSTTEITTKDSGMAANGSGSSAPSEVTAAVIAEAQGPGPNNLVRVTINLKANVKLTNPPPTSNSNNEVALRVAIWEHLRKNGPDPLSCCNKCGGCPDGCFPLTGWFNNSGSQPVSTCPGFTANPNSWINPTKLICTNKAGFDLFAFDPFKNCEGGLIGKRTGSCGCFTPETKILMGDGNTMAIRDIRPGDFVLNPITKKPIRVKEVIKGPEKVEIFEIGYKGQKVFVTGTHPFPTRTGMKAAFHLEPGDQLLDADNNWVTIETLNIRKADDQTEVWNIRLDVATHNEQDHLVWADGIVTGDLGMQERLARDNAQ